MDRSRTVWRRESITDQRLPMFQPPRSPRGFGLPVLFSEGGMSELLYARRLVAGRRSSVYNSQMTDADLGRRILQTFDELRRAKVNRSRRAILTRRCLRT